MGQKVLVDPRADRDLDEQFQHIAGNNRDAALRFLTSARETFEQIATSPELGSIWGFRNPRLAEVRVWRVRGFKNHLIFYRAIEGGIEIIRVLHGARDIAGLFESEDADEH